MNLGTLSCRLSFTILKYSLILARCHSTPSPFSLSAFRLKLYYVKYAGSMSEAFIMSRVDGHCIDFGSDDRQRLRSVWTIPLIFSSTCLYSLNSSWMSRCKNYLRRSVNSFSKLVQGFLNRSSLSFIISSKGLSLPLLGSPEPFPLLYMSYIVSFEIPLRMASTSSGVSSPLYKAMNSFMYCFLLA